MLVPATLLASLQRDARSYFSALPALGPLELIARYADARMAIGTLRLHGEPYRCVGTIHTGPLSRPSGLVLSSSGTLFVADADAVLAFRIADGSLVRTIRALDGTAAMRPRGVALASDGTLFVTDEANDRVCVFCSNNGSFQREFGARGEMPGLFYWPYDVSLSRCSALVAVSDHNNHRVQLFRAVDGSFVRFIGGTRGGELGEMTFPRGVAFHPCAHELYLTDEANHGRVLGYSLDHGTIVRVHFTKRHDAERSSVPLHIAIDAAGSAAVSTAHSIFVVSHDSTVVRTVGLGELVGCPSGLAIDSLGRLYVTECEAHRVSVWT